MRSDRSPRSPRAWSRCARARRAVTVACLALVLVAFSVAPAAATEPSPPPVRAEAGLLIDLATGQVLYAKNAGEDRAPASLVKLMTLYLAH
ncbi:MAG TPA: hypothetical protein VGB42_00005, partial [Candidatus Thermoplasmatota archaeon]